MGFKAIKQHYDIGYIVGLYITKKNTAGIVFVSVPGLFTGL